MAQNTTNNMNMDDMMGDGSQKRSSGNIKSDREKASKAGKKGGQKSNRRSM